MFFPALPDLFFQPKRNMTTLIHPVVPHAALTAEAFSEAYAKGFQLTVRFLLSKGAPPDIAEEVSQSAWARGWEARAQLLLKEKLIPWINRIAYHRFCNDRKRASRHSDLAEHSVAAAGCNTQAQLDANKVLKMCKPRDQKMLVQRYLAGMEMKEIAALQGISEIAVRVRLHRCQCGIRAAILNCTCAQ